MNSATKPALLERTTVAGQVDPTEGEMVEHVLYC